MSDEKYFLDCTDEGMFFAKTDSGKRIALGADGKDAAIAELRRMNAEQEMSQRKSLRELEEKEKNDIAERNEKKPTEPHTHELPEYQENILAAFTVELDGAIRETSDILASLTDKIMRFGNPTQRKWLRDLAATVVDILDGKTIPPGA